MCSTLGLDQPNERADHAIEETFNLRLQWTNPLEGPRRLEARKRLARRSRSRLISSVPILAARISTPGGPVAPRARPRSHAPRKNFVHASHREAALSH
jgi:hypothetical protein